MSGQDTKAVLLNDQREVTDFEMNDKCAAGTGKFLEVMARALGLSLDEFNTAGVNALELGRAPADLCNVRGFRRKRGHRLECLPRGPAAGRVPRTRARAE